jgi:hypothetical protein
MVAFGKAVWEGEKSKHFLLHPYLKPVTECLAVPDHQEQFGVCNHARVLW